MISSAMRFKFPTIDCSSKVSSEWEAKCLLAAEQKRFTVASKYFNPTSSELWTIPPSLMWFCCRFNVNVSLIHVSLAQMPSAPSIESTAHTKVTVHIAKLIAKISLILKLDWTKQNRCFGYDVVSVNEQLHIQEGGRILRLTALIKHLRTGKWPINKNFVIIVPIRNCL